MAEELQTVENYELRPKQIAYVVARCIVVNLFSLIVLPLINGTFFVALAMTIAALFQNLAPIVLIAVMIIISVINLILVGFIGCQMTIFGQGPIGYLTHQKIRLFALTSTVILVPTIFYCLYLVIANLADPSKSNIGFCAGLAIPNLMAYLLGQLAAVVVSDSHLKAAGQIARGYSWIQPPRQH